MEVVPLPVDRSRDAACLLADAFRDYPAWRSIGPRRAHPRRRMVERFYRGALARAGELGEVLSASEDGRLRGIAITYPPERWPPSLASFYHEAWGVALCGPGAIVRGLRATAAVDAAHPREPHVFLHTLGVDPAAQRRGAGAALLERMTSVADERRLPIHLTTSTTENLPYYRRFGFELDGERRLPRDVPLWSMLRPATEPEPTLPPARGPRPSSPPSASP